MEGQMCDYFESCKHLLYVTNEIQWADLNKFAEHRVNRMRSVWSYLSGDK